MAQKCNATSRFTAVRDDENTRQRREQEKIWQWGWSRSDKIPELIGWFRNDAIYGVANTRGLEII